MWRDSIWYIFIRLIFFTEWGMEMKNKIMKKELKIVSVAAIVILIIVIIIEMCILYNSSLKKIM